jgi:hypothetical protein
MNLFSCLAGRQPTPRQPRRTRLALENLEDRLQPSISLGAAAGFGVLGLQHTDIDNRGVTVKGSEGVSQRGTLSNSATSTIFGTVDEYAQKQYSGRGSVGNLVINPALITQADQDALQASSQAAALAATQTFGTISQATTVTGNGNFNVIAVNGDIQNSLILSGTANDVFVVNVTGNVGLAGQATLGLGGGVIPSHVLYNFTGAGATIVTQAGNVVNGTLLAPGSSFNLAGTITGEIIGGGRSLTLLGGATVVQVPFDATPITGSLSGFVRDESTGVGISGITVTLSWLDSLGQTQTKTTTTLGDGSYSFSGLTATTYTLTETLPSVMQDGQNTVGNLGGTPDAANCRIVGIVLTAGANGSNYNFQNIPLV